MKDQPAVDGLGRFDADVPELATLGHASYVSMPRLDVVDAHHDHEVVGPVLHVIVLEPELVSVELEVGRSTPSFGRLESQRGVEPLRKLEALRRNVCLQITDLR